MGSRVDRLKKFRKEAGWEIDPPRCGNCTLYNPQHVDRRISPDLKYQPPTCNKHEFTTQPQALCDHWIGADGLGLS